ncbi:hypothetical protein QOZ80_1AG0013360 [Eleusine coracana subsp. coracana]|nr:hypothetical protein QOZ80_1AG0013360 [Eleusine coracana subsp. coracana]
MEVENPGVVGGDMFELALVTNDFPDNTFEEDERELDEENQVEGEVFISSDSEGEDDESYGRQSADDDYGVHNDSVDLGEGNVGHENVEEVVHEDTTNNSNEGVSEPSVFDGVVEIDWSKHYTAEELRALRDMNVELPKVSNHHDLPRIMFAISDNGLLSKDAPPSSSEPMIRKGMIFDSMADLKHFFEDYAVRHHRLYYVVNSNRVMAPHLVFRLLDLNLKQFKPLRIRTHHPMHFDEHLVPYIEPTGFLPLARVVSSGLPSMDVVVLISLVDRWRPESHTFLLPCGELTLTLQDVAMITALPIDGIAICDTMDPVGWRDVVQEWLGLRPPETEEDERDKKAAGVSSKWLVDNFVVLDKVEYPEMYLHAAAKAWLWHFVASFLFPDGSGNIVSWICLPYLTKPWDELPNYSWGSAILAWLYRQLVDRRKEKGRVEWANTYQAWLLLWNNRHEKAVHYLSGPVHRPGPYKEYLLSLYSLSRLKIRPSLNVAFIAELPDSDTDEEIVDEYDEATRTGRQLERAPFEDYADTIGLFQLRDAPDVEGTQHSPPVDRVFRRRRNVPTGSTLPTEPGREKSKPDRYTLGSAKRKKAKK